MKPRTKKMIQKTIRLMRISSRMFGIMLVILTLAFAGCKSKKKAMEANTAAEKARMEQEAALQKQREEEEQRKRAAEEEAEKARRVDEMRTREPAHRLEQYFSAISSATNLPSANSSISEALTLFASDDTPVLIVISESGGQKDYDRPTTIKDYLNYLKDQKKRADKIGNLQFDGSGKITEVELIKQQ